MPTYAVWCRLFFFPFKSKVDRPVGPEAARLGHRLKGMTARPVSAHENVDFVVNFRRLENEKNPVAFSPNVLDYSSLFSIVRLANCVACSADAELPSVLSWHPSDGCGGILLFHLAGPRAVHPNGENFYDAFFQ